MCFKINDNEREKLQKPLSNIYAEKEIIELIKKSNHKIISVGDYTTLMLLKNGLNPFIAAIDFKISRVSVTGNDKFLLNEYFHNATSCKNKPGCLGECTLEWAKSHIQKGGCIIIDGEEDLVAIPLIYYMDERSILLYGQRNRGTVAILGNEKDGIKIIKDIMEKVNKHKQDLADRT